MMDIAKVGLARDREISDTSSTSPDRLRGIRARVDAKVEAEVNRRVSRQIKRRLEALDRHVKGLTKERDNLQKKLRSVRDLNRRCGLAKQHTSNTPHIATGPAESS
jgi:hypothetical protein